MAIVFVDKIEADSCLACAPSDFTAMAVEHRVNETHPQRDGREWTVSRTNLMPDGRNNPCHCPNMMGRRHWRLTR